MEVHIFYGNDVRLSKNVTAPHALEDERNVDEVSCRKFRALVCLVRR